MITDKYLIDIFDYLYQKINIFCLQIARWIKSQKIIISIYGQLRLYYYFRFVVLRNNIENVQMFSLIKIYYFWNYVFKSLFSYLTKCNKTKYQKQEKSFTVTLLCMNLLSLGIYLIYIYICMRCANAWKSRGMKHWYLKSMIYMNSCWRKIKDNYPGFWSW